MSYAEIDDYILFGKASPETKKKSTIFSEKTSISAKCPPFSGGIDRFFEAMRKIL